MLGYLARFSPSIATIRMILVGLVETVHALHRFGRFRLAASGFDNSDFLSCSFHGGLDIGILQGRGRWGTGRQDQAGHEHQQTGNQSNLK